MTFLKQIFPFLNLKRRNGKLVLPLLLFVLSFSVSGQELTLALSKHPNKQAIIVAVHGIRKDTLGTILLDQNGKGSLAFKNKQIQAGLVNLTIKDKPYLGYDFVLSPIESPTLICDMEYVYAQNTKILDSPENDCLNRWFDDVKQYKQKININLELSNLYKPKTAFFTQLENEKIATSEKLKKLTDTINLSTLFAGKYMQFKIAQEEKLGKVWENNEQRTVAQNYFTQIDFDALYGSSMWFAIINSCIEAYAKEGKFYETFGRDIVSNLKRIKNEKVFEDLLDAAISVTEKFAWNTDQETIAEFIVKDNRIINPQGKLLKIMQSYNLSKGKKAPDLTIINYIGEKENNNSKAMVLKTSELNSKYTLLVFYRSGCGPCEDTLLGLMDNYNTMKNKGFRIITIAADTETKVFNDTSLKHPWKDKYCDFVGTNGVNFKNYAVIGTPTMYVLDSKGNIYSKMATISDVLSFVNKK